MKAVPPFLDRLPRIRQVRTEPFALPVPFESAARRLSQIPGTVLLLSGGRHDCARYHILGTKPWLTLTGRMRHLRLEAFDRVLETDGDPFEALRAILEHWRTTAPVQKLPLSAGLLGYLAYDLKDVIEDLPRTAIDRWGLPHICLYAPSVLLVQDRAADATWLSVPAMDAGETPETLKRWLVEALAAAPTEETGFSCCAGGFAANFEASDYRDAIVRIKDYIADGHVYQVNMSQRFETRFTGDPFALFQALYHRNPAPFYAFINAGDHQIVSTSPERFLLRQGQQVETRPIKGTRPRGTTPEADAALREDLAGSRKDDAELSMIVDLLRNDIGKVCEAGTVRVTEHKRIEAYENVYHQVSIVEGHLAETCDSVDLVRATFPGGSITGCPKIRAMEIIDELEPDNRHIYTGAIGYIGFHDTLDLSIAIRTATLHKGRLFFSVGGGIVFDSDPLAEYEETLHKGKTLLDVFGDRTTCAEPVAYVWMNGRILPLSRAVVPITDPGVLYGYGFFETIRVDRGRSLHLEAHLKRFQKTWQALFAPEPFPDLTWHAVVESVIERNGLTDRTAAVRLTATRGVPDDAGSQPNLFMTARPYRHRLEVLGQTGLRLATYSEPRQSPLAAHKTLNYLYYLKAGEWAATQGADEAVVLNPDGTVSETNTANLLWIRGRRVVLPASAHVLPGVMVAAVCEALASMGFSIEERPMSPADLTGADQVLVTNSLMGAVPAIAVDGKRLPTPDDLADRINRAVLG